MENNRQIEFQKFVQQVLNKHLDCNLKLDNQLYVELADKEKGIYVEIKEAFNDTTSRNLKNLIYKLKKELITHEFYIIFNQILSYKQKDALLNHFENDYNNEYYVLDINDLNLIAQNYGYSIWEQTKRETDYSNPDNLSLDEKQKVQLKDLINSRKFFLGGHIWGDIDKLENFIALSIWENGNVENDVDAVISAKKGDLVFLKSTFAKSYLRLKAVGVVVSNSHDGYLLSVFWHKFKTFIDIDDLGKYRRTFQRIMPDDIENIIKRVSVEETDFLEIINKLDDRAENLGIGLQGSPNEYPLNKNKTLFYGQKIGEEISNYNIIFLPKSFKSTRDDNGISSAVLNLLGLPFSFLPLKENYFDENQFKWMPYRIKDRDGYLCHILIVGKDGKYLNFEKIFPLAIEEFKDSYKILSNKAFDVFVPLLGAGLGHMPSMESLKQVLSGLNSISKLIKINRLRINLPRGLSDNSVTEHIQVIKKSLNSFSDEFFENNRGIEQHTSSTTTSNDLAFADKDLLGFEADVKVFASLIALKKMDPPLAIALFGNWGTGKSFFMYQLEKKIKELSKYQGFIELVDRNYQEAPASIQDKYCKGIAHIRFNAWSYLDSNLWAGLVHAIFEKLNEYISESTKSGVAKLKVQAKLNERLKSLNSIKETTEIKKNRLELLKNGYELESEKLSKDITQKIEVKLLEICNANEELKKAYSRILFIGKNQGDFFNVKFGKIVDEYKYWKRFCENLRKKPQIITYIGFGLLGILLAAILNYYSIWNSNFHIISFPIISVLMKGISWFGERYLKIKKYVGKFNKLVESSPDLKNDIEELEKKIELIETQKRQAEEQIKELDIKILNIKNDFEDLNTATIREFINNRTDHKDYKDHLGIISTIRKDFETLSELFLEKTEEIKKEKTEINQEETTKTKLDEDREFVKEQFDEGKKLERIVLYIDDLDRCPDEKVLEVLQAVHLLMAFPLFIVIVGIDKRCVNNALNYQNILKYYHATNSSNIHDLKNNFGIEIIQPNEYLEKIFQIPFQIPEAIDSGVHKMIFELLKGQIKEEFSEVKTLDDKSDTAHITISSRTNILEFNDSNENLELNESNESMFLDNNPKIDNNEEMPPEDLVNKEIIPISPPDLTISNNELEQIKQMSSIIGKTPRTIKRFINIYRIIRAHSKLEDDSLNEENKMAIMLILAINMGVRQDLAKKFFAEIEKVESKALGDIITIKDYPELYFLHENDLLNKLLKVECGTICKYVTFIKRFSFGDMLIPDFLLKDELSFKKS